MRKADEFVQIDVDKIQEAPWNHKKTDPDAQRRLIANIKRNGQRQNINVRKLPGDMYEVIDGNHRLRAYKELGITKALCYNHGPITLAEAMRLSMECREYFKADTMKHALVLRDAAVAFSINDLAETSAMGKAQLADVLSIAEIDSESLEGSIAQTVTKEKRESLTMAVRCTTLENRVRIVNALKARCEKMGAQPDVVGLGMALHAIIGEKGLL